MKQSAETHLYEIYLTSSNITADAWQKLFHTLAELSRPGSHWQIFTKEKHAKLHFYLETSLILPASPNNLPEFLLQSPESPVTPPRSSRLRFCPTLPTTNFIVLKNYLPTRKCQNLISIQISFHKLIGDRFISQTIALTDKFSYSLLVASPAELLAIDFASNRHILYKSAPKYLDAQKILPFLNEDKKSALLKVETFPYQTAQSYLHQQSLDFAKHSLVLGASGSGKSKFLSLFIENLATNSEFKENYKIVVIDPHAALEDDIGAYARTIDFQSEADSIQLFDNTSRDPIVATELMLELLKSLLADNYNPKVARVLRHSVSILISLGQFNFHNLNSLLLDLEYRNQILRQRQKLPAASLEFFLTEYNEIKTRFYTEAISPIIALIDEIDMIPVLGKPINAPDLKTTVKDNFLTLFSLDRTKLGDRVTATLSGIVIQQLFTLIQNRTFNEHIIFIIDEVAVIENPILKRFLSEARKFNLSLILAGQYFGAISEELRTAIFANTTNYYIFRVAKDDAASLVQSLDFKIPLEDTMERKIKAFTDLQNRECIARVSCGNQLLPAVKCQTLDFTPHPRIKTPMTALATNLQATASKIIQFTVKNAKKFQEFFATKKHREHRIKGDTFEQHVMADPTKFKLGVKK